MKEQIFNFLKKQYPGVAFDVSYPPAGRAGPPEGFGDYSTNIAFLLAKKLGRKPQEVADELVKKLKKEYSKEFEKIEVAKNGFVNFYLSPEFLKHQLAQINKNYEEFFKINLGKNQTVIVEYSQPNIAKVMHVGHLRGTIVGDALANLYESFGYKVIRWNYIGDWGAQFGRLIAAYKLWGRKERVQKNPIETLNDLYVRFHDELKNKPELEEQGKEEFRKLEEGDKENRKLWEWFKKESLDEFNRIYKIFAVRFDTYIGESFFEKDLKSLVSELLSKGMAKESQGAIIIDLGRVNLPPALIRKTDGTSLYLTRDIAGLRYRISKYNPEKILYVVGSEQFFHFQQLFAIAAMMDMKKPELIHVKFGLILGEDKKKLSTREGRAVPMLKLINKSVELASKILEEKKPNLSEKEKDEISKAVGIGSLKYFILKERFNSDIVFNWNKILDFKGDSGPYLQYTYARLKSILRKSRDYREADFNYLDNKVKYSVAKKILMFKEILEQCEDSYAINHLVLYLYELCNLVNKFYEVTPAILKDKNIKRRNLNLILIDITSKTLYKGMGILGIKALEEI